MLQITAAIQLIFFEGKEKTHMLWLFEFENVNSSLMRKLPQHLQSIFIIHKNDKYDIFIMLHESFVQTKTVEINMYLYYIITPS